MLQETVAAALQVIGLDAYKAGMGEASKATAGVGDAAKTTAKDVSGSSKDMQGSAGKVAAGLAAAGAAGLVAKKGLGFMKGAADDATALAKQTAGLQRITGRDAKTASAWVSMTKERGIESAQLTKGFVTLSKQMVSAAGGSKTSAKAFDALGTSGKQLMALPLDQRMAKIADGFAAMPNGAQKAALAQQLFGKQGQALLPILNSGAKGMGDQMAAMSKYGLTLDQNGVKKSLELAKSQREMQSTMAGVKLAIGSALIPVIADLAKVLLPIMTGFSTAIQKWPALGPIILAIAAGFTALMVISSVAGAVTAIIPLLPLLAAGFTAVWAAITGPVGLVVIGIAAVVAAFVLLYNKVQWFHDAVDAVFNFISANWPLLLTILTGPFGLAVAIITGHFGQLKAGAQAVVSAVAGFFTGLPGMLASVGQQLVNVIIGPLRGLPGQALAIGKSIVESIASGIASAPGAIMNAIESVLPGPLKKAAGGVSGVLSAIPHAMGGIVAAQGGMATGAGKTVLVGERGPELASMPSGTRITPLPPPALSPSQLMGGAGGVVHTHVYLDRREIALAMGDYTADQQAAR